MSRKIEVLPYDPEWKRKFTEEAKAIKKILGKNCVSIHHIGSTAVKGLAAKPTIDIMPVVKDISALDSLDGEFEALGYQCKGEFGIPGRRFYIKGEDTHTHHVHVFEVSNKDEINRHIAFRDYLMNFPDEAKKYADLKIDLAERCGDDSTLYCDGKADFVKELEKKALKWSERQSGMATCLSIGMCLGMSIGMAIGAALDNISIGMCMGMGVGMCLGVAYGSSKYKDNDDKKDK